VGSTSSISSEIYITQPNGLVTKESFPDALVDAKNKSLLANATIKKEIILSQNGAYRVEVNDTSGFALLNQQFVFGSHLAIAPNDLDAVTDKSIGNRTLSSIIGAQL